MTGGSGTKGRRELVGAKSRAVRTSGLSSPAAQRGGRGQAIHSRGGGRPLEISAARRSTRQIFKHYDLFVLEHSFFFCYAPFIFDKPNIRRAQNVHQYAQRPPLRFGFPRS